MCLAVAGKIISVEGKSGVVDIGGVKRNVSLHLVPEAGVGTWVLLHAGFAIQSIDEQEAKTTMSLLEEMFSSNQHLNNQS
ncbi:MAG: HypC/HybG/HupF family hydrogenase formation chaperone [Spirochaetota bacterium]